VLNPSQILLDELGFDPGLLNPLHELYLQPISKILFPAETGEGLDTHKAFIVTYGEGKDVDLDFHFDNAEVTLNVSLNADFTEGCLYFGRLNTEAAATSFAKCEHRVTRGVLHRGQHMHGALPIGDEEGERYNLIVWMRSSSVRNRMCPMCRKQPDLVEMPDGSGDGFTAPQVELCSLA
jgi:hypothetical protein